MPSVPAATSIDAATLLAHLPEHLDAIEEHGIVYRVHVEQQNWRGDTTFILGPPEICGAALGLIDPEYGWPFQVAAETTTSVAELAPRHRRHPVVTLGGRAVAMGIQEVEYAWILADGAAP